LIDVYIGIGSNLGDKKENCLRALDMLRRLKGTRVLEVSPFYRTEPVGVEDDQDWYLNAVAMLNTTLTARQLMAELLGIEKVLGRQRIKRWDSRTIDLDILFYGDRIVKESDLEIPHPRVHLRRFVLVPLMDLAPDLVHPVFHETIRELLAKCPEDGQEVRKDED